MGEFLLWLINQISYLVSQVLNWKIIGDLSFLHFILGGVIISLIIKFISFGINKEE